MIKGAVLNAPGSWHNAKVARPIYTKLLEKTPEGFYLVADTVFPRGTNAIAGCIRAPLKAGQRVPAQPDERDAFLAFNGQLLSYRQAAEWSMQQLRGGFGHLRVPLDADDPVGRQELLEVCVHLSNLRAERVGPQRDLNSVHAVLGGGREY